MSFFPITLIIFPLCSNFSLQPQCFMSSVFISLMTFYTLYPLIVAVAVGST